MMQPLTDIGFITMAFGAEKYFQQAHTLARSVKRHMPQHQLALVTDRAVADPLFDRVIHMKAIDQAGTVLKTDLYDYSPYEETFFIDSDCVVVRDFSEQLAGIRRYDFSPIVGVWYTAGDQDLWIDDVGEAVRKLDGTAFPKFNGGVYFYRKSAHAEEVFTRAKALRARQAELGIKDFDRSGPGEETLIGLALSQMHVRDLYFDEGMLMRTPLNTTGPLRVDPLAGECSFVKEGVRVTPAICHYCGDWINHPTYLVATKGLRDGRRPSAAWRLQTHLVHKARGVARKLKRKMG